MEDQKALQTRAVISNVTNAIQNLIDDLLADGVMATRVIVCGILLPVDQQVRMKELFVGTVADLV